MNKLELLADFKDVIKLFRKININITEAMSSQEILELTQKVYVVGDGVYVSFVDEYHSKTTARFVMAENQDWQNAIIAGDLTYEDCPFIMSAKDESVYEVSMQEIERINEFLDELEMSDELYSEQPF